MADFPAKGDRNLPNRHNQNALFSQNKAFGLS
jgi:hypothetical protein